MVWKSVKRTNKSLTQRYAMKEKAEAAMILYGIPEGSESATNLNEVTFSADPDQLLALSRFFAAMADYARAGRDDFWHVHYSDFDRTAPKFPQVIVCRQPSLNFPPAVKTGPPDSGTW